MARALCRDHRGSWLFFLHKSVPVPPRFTLANGHQPRCASFSLLARAGVSRRETWLLLRSLRSFARAVSEVVPCSRKNRFLNPSPCFMRPARTRNCHRIDRLGRPRYYAGPRGFCRCPLPSQILIFRRNLDPSGVIHSSNNTPLQIWSGLRQKHLAPVCSTSHRSIQLFFTPSCGRVPPRDEAFPRSFRRCWPQEFSSASVRDATTDDRRLERVNTR